MKNRLIPIALAAAVWAAAGAAAAQTADQPATEPGIQGQFSTQSPAGVGNPANPTQKPNKTEPMSRAAVRAEAAANNKSSGNTATPAGEFSTRVNNQPNVTPRAGALTRQEVRVGALKTKPHFGERAPSAVPTNPQDGTGTPQ